MKTQNTTLKRLQTLYRILNYNEIKLLPWNRKLHPFTRYWREDFLKLRVDYTFLFIPYLMVFPIYHNVNMALGSILCKTFLWCIYFLILWKCIVVGNELFLQSWIFFLNYNFLMYVASYWLIKKKEKKMAGKIF